MIAKIVSALIAPLGTALLLGLFGLALQAAGLTRKIAGRRLAMAASALDFRSCIR